MAGADAVTLSRGALTDLAAAAFRGTGVGAAEAEAAAIILVLAEMMEIRTHGVRRVPVYGARLRNGGIDPAARIACEVLAPGLRRIDGANGLGPAIGARALEEAIAAARETGIAAVFCRRSNHFGAVAPYALLAARAGFISIIGSNATPLLAPAGGREARVGNNPLGFGFPRPGGDPVILDMAMSVAARSKIRDAAEAGRPIPAGWATDRAGRPTTDAASAMAGLLLPIGGHKGLGLALAVDLLGGLLSGAAFLTGTASLTAQPGAAQDLGQVFVLIDARRLMPESELASRMEAFARALHETPRIDEATSVRLPGERALACLARAESDGVAIDRVLLRALEAMASEGAPPEAWAPP